MTFLLGGILTYLFTFLYVVTGALNFIAPIGGTTLLFLLPLVTALVVYASQRWTTTATDVPVSHFAGTPRRLWLATWGAVFLCQAAFVLIVRRPTLDSDALVYRLPLSLLMNESRWFPGIGRLSPLYAYPNGDSVIASALTTFGVHGLETVFNLLAWLMLGIVSSAFLLRHGVGLSLSLAVAAVFLLTPAMFWQSYNMGSDLPCSLFILLSLISLAERHPHEAVLYAALSAVFKPLGLVALVFSSCWLVAMTLAGRTRLFRSPYSILATLLIVVLCARAFVAVGNPFFPIVSLHLGSWGVPVDGQAELIEGLVGYSGAHRTLMGALDFAVAFLLEPKIYKSSYWFSPLFVVAVAGVVMARRRHEGRFPGLTAEVKYTVFVCLVCLCVWFASSPLFRFAAGFLMFICLAGVVACVRCGAVVYRQLVLWPVILLLLCAFGWNAARHLRDDVAPFIDQADVAKYLPYSHAIFREARTVRGLPYIISESTYCGWQPPPCVSEHTVGDVEEILETYERWNGR